MTNGRTSGIDVSDIVSILNTLITISKEFVKADKKLWYKNYSDGRLEFQSLCGFSFQKQLW